MANCPMSPEKERHVEVSKNLLTLRALHLFDMVGSMLVMTASSEMMMLHPEWIGTDDFYDK